MTEKKLLIENSFMNLMEDYRFREITIKMICAEANINRSTFYAYFEDKYALLDGLIKYHLLNITQILDRTQEEMLGVTDRKPCVKKYLLELFTYIEANKKFFRILVTLHPAQNFTQKLMETFRTGYLEILEKVTNIKYPDHFVNYTLGGQFGVMFFWLREDCPEPVELISDIVYRNVMRHNR